MAGTRSWCTKADIMKDLYQVSGRTGEVNEEFIIIGQKPPPPRRFDDDDDELETRFGVQTNCSTPLNEEKHSPDLKGITDMLRMVDDYNDVECTTIETSPASSTEVVSISKLDPRVPEFVPKGSTSSSPDSNKENLQNDKSKCVEKEKLASVDEKKACVDIGKRIDVSKLKPEEISDISKELRTKISNVSNKDNLHSKKERNVAIATLLKIYSAAPSSSESPQPVVKTIEEPIKLLSPEYFEKTVNINTDLETVKEEEKILLNNNNLHISDNVKKEHNGIIEEEKPVAASISLPLKCPKENKHYEDEQVRESINKVNRWFQNPKSPKPKGPVVCLGPIEFKKKSNPASNNGSEVESKRSTPTKPVISNYKPSQYAQDLSKMFTERNKTRELEQKDMWEKVQIMMKEKEEKLKQKQLEKASLNSTSQGNSTNDDEDSSNSSL